MPILIPLGKSGVRNTAVDVAAPREGGGGREEEGGGREGGGGGREGGGRLRPPRCYVHRFCLEGLV